MLPDTPEDKFHELNLPISSKSDRGIRDDVLDAENKARTLDITVLVP
jgi:hypothetical protein